MRAACLIAITTALVGCAGAPPAPVSSALAGKVAPDFAAERPDGSPLWLSSLRGRVLVLDLWASWCRGCEEKLPALDAMARRLKVAGIETWAVSLDENRQSFTRVIDKRSWQMTTLFDSSGKVGDLYQPADLPSIYVIDSRGVVRHSMTAYTQSDLPRIEAQARALASNGHL